ncbi:MAG: hypothetical protein WBD40_09535 [Tepidisphaeraceae bacterium]
MHVLAVPTAPYRASRLRRALPMMLRRNIEKLPQIPGPAMQFADAKDAAFRSRRAARRDERNRSDFRDVTMQCEPKGETMQVA